MVKILVSCALILFSLAGWQHTQTQAEDTVLCDVPGQTVVEEELRVEYPDLWRHNTIVSFGVKDCRWCPAQKAHLRSLAIRGYRVAYFDADRHKKLYAYLRDETTTLPLTVVFVEGKLKQTFAGFTPWRRIARDAKECKTST